VVEPTAKVARDVPVASRSLSRVVRGLADVPTLFRFLAVVAILAGLAFAAMFALATFVEPTPREISVTIPNAKLQPK
jgi:hypothetical protein